MPIYKTKHTPIDDNPYIVYGATQSNVPDMVTYIGIEATKSVAQGANYTFPVTMQGSGEYDSTVAWSLAVESGGTIKSGTTLTQAGKLTVDAAQATTKKLYVTATASTGQAATCTVTVTS